MTHLTSPAQNHAAFVFAVLPKDVTCPPFCKDYKKSIEIEEGCLSSERPLDHQSVLIAQHAAALMPPALAANKAASQTCVSSKPLLAEICGFEATLGWLQKSLCILCRITQLLRVTTSDFCSLPQV